MRRLLNEPMGYLKRLFVAARSGWDRFVFTPADPTSLGMIRLVVGSLAVWSLFVYGLDLKGYLGTTGWSDPSIVRQFASEDAPTSWSFWLLVPDSLLRPVWVLAIGILIAFTVGLGSRLTAILAWVIFVSTVRRSPVSVYGFDQILSTWMFYLAATGASGQAVSIDHYLSRLRRNRSEVARRSRSGLWTAPSGRPEPTINANIALRLIQCHLVLIYAVAALAKFQGPAWWTGDAFWRTIAAGEFRLFDLTWLAAYPRFLEFCTHAALLIELTYPVLVWVGILRPLMMTAVVFVHAGIGITLGLTEFSLAMIAGNLAFVSGPWLRSLVAGREPGKVSGRVLYDGACPRCRASMAILSASDPDRLVEPVDLTAVEVANVHPALTKEACLRTMHLVRDDGRIETGFDAVMTIAGWMPLFTIPSLVRYVPGVSWIGRRAYNAIAASRPRDVICTDETCGIHARPATPPAPPFIGKAGS